MVMRESVTERKESNDVDQSSEGMGKLVDMATPYIVGADHLE